MTPTVDCFGNVVSGADAGTLAGIDDFAEGFLAYETRAERIVAAADAAPDCCIANVYAGFLWMFLESPDAAAHAAGNLARAKKAAAFATPRECECVTVLQAWSDNDIALAIDVCERITRTYEHDLVIAKLSQYFDFNRGDFPAMLRTALRVLDANAEVPYVHGMAAFAYEQCHLLDEAETSARRALQLRFKEPWAQHSLAHVYLTRGEIDAGAVSLLARIELADIPAGDRWVELGQYLAARAGDTVQPFLSMQYLYGLARAGRAEADALLAAVRHSAASAPVLRDVWREVALPACEGLLAHARGDFETARVRIGVALPRMIETGGSHAQRDLFEQIWLDAVLRSGRLTLAQQLMEVRRRSDPNGVPLNRRLAQVYEKLGLPEQAVAAQVRADRGMR